MQPVPRSARSAAARVLGMLAAAAACTAIGALADSMQLQPRAAVGAELNHEGGAQKGESQAGPDGGGATVVGAVEAAGLLPGEGSQGAAGSLVPDLGGSPPEPVNISQVGPIYWWVDPKPEPASWIRNPVTQLEVDAMPELTGEGRKIRRVLIYSLVGGTCRSDDWRGDLPKHLLRYMANARAVMIDASPSMHRNNWTCSECRSDVQPHFWDFRMDCDYYFGARGEWSRHPADLALVFGAGAYMPCGEESPLDVTCQPWRDKSYDRQRLYPDLRALFTSGLVTEETLKIHIPIRKTHYLNEHPVFPFRHILTDSHFLKPLSTKSFADMMKLCNGTEKGSDLLYVARYTDMKGQLEFLERVDPVQLDGYTVHFYGSNTESDNRPFFDKIEQAAAAKGIKIEIHLPVTKEELFPHYCRAAGQIHFATSDNNPRCVYEGLSAGMPVFTTVETGLHPDLYQRSFVVSLDAEDKPNFDAAFAYFMYQVRNPDLIQPRIQWFVQKFLRPSAVYQRMCKRLGICADSLMKPEEDGRQSGVGPEPELAGEEPGPLDPEEVGEEGAMDAPGPPKEKEDPDESHGVQHNQHLRIWRDGFSHGNHHSPINHEHQVVRHVNSIPNKYFSAKTKATRHSSQHLRGDRMGRLPDGAAWEEI